MKTAVRCSCSSNLGMVLVLALVFLVEYSTLLIIMPILAMVFSFDVLMIASAQIELNEVEQ